MASDAEKKEREEAELLLTKRSVANVKKVLFTFWSLLGLLTIRECYHLASYLYCGTQTCIELPGVLAYLK